MQYDMARFEQPLVDETQPKAHVWTDIGEAEVEHSIFGNAKVRVYRQKDEVRGAVRWTLATIGIVVGAVWLINDVSRQPEIVYVAPPEPAVGVVTPESQKPVPVASRIQARVTPPIAIRKPLPQLQATPAPVVVSGASAPVAAKPSPVAAKPATVGEAPVAAAVKPLVPVTPVTATVPVTDKPEVTQTPAVASSAVTATN